jgi:hypothetical protein
MSWYHKHIRAGQLFRLTNIHYRDYIYYRDYNFEPVPLNAIVMIIDLETIAGNVSFLLGEHIDKMDATSFLTMFAPIKTE